MQSAYLKGTDQKVYARDADDLECEKFECTGCGSTMFLRNGMVRISHFYHAPDSFCSFSQGESEEQVRYKNSIYDTFRKKYASKGINVEMEYTGIPGCRADVFLIGRKHKIAIEILIEATDVRQIIDKTETYFRANVGVIWILPFDCERIYSGNTRTMFNRFKMKEHEKLLYFMNNKKLLFWNTKFSSLTIASFAPAYGDSAEFYDVSQGSMVYYDGKKLRSTFQITELVHKKYPDDLKRWFSPKRFEMKTYKYPLPKSILWKYAPSEEA